MAHRGGAGCSITARGLKVEPRPKSDHLRVTFTDKNPDTAALAVRSTIDAFGRAFIEVQSKVEHQRMVQLTSRRESLTAELASKEASSASEAQGRTLSEVEPLLYAALERLKKLKAMLADVQCAMASGTELPYRQTAQPRTPEDIAVEERRRTWAAEQFRVTNQLAQYQAQGFGPNHPTMVRLAASAQKCEEELEACRQAAERRSPDSADSPPLSLAEREINLIPLVRTANDEVTLFAAQRSRLKVLEEQAGVLRASLNETASRLDALETESALSGRLTVVSAGDRPLTAVLDNRAKYAAAGAVTGMALPLTLMAALGLRHRRYRYTDEIVADLRGRAPFVAALPDLVDLGPLSAVAAHCIHDLHVRLQPHHGSEPRALLVTSAAAGEGKTSLAMALGLSFATSGFRTLLIDGDPILTGIRASVIAPLADGVILAVSRDQEQTLVDNAVRHVELLGGVLAGAVFNRADESEFRAALREQPQSPALGHRRLPEKLNRFGPLVATMLSSLSLSRESDLDLSAPGPVLAASDESRQAA